jgi:hypothetical protein
MTCESCGKTKGVKKRGAGDAPWLCPRCYKRFSTHENIEINAGVGGYAIGTTFVDLTIVDDADEL